MKTFKKFLEEKYIEIPLPNDKTWAGDAGEAFGPGGPGDPATATIEELPDQPVDLVHPNGLVQTHNHRVIHTRQPYDAKVHSKKIEKIPQQLTIASNYDPHTRSVRIMVNTFERGDVGHRIASANYNRDGLQILHATTGGVGMYGGYNPDVISARILDHLDRHVVQDGLPTRVRDIHNQSGPLGSEHEDL